MTDPFEIGLFERLAEPFMPEQVHWRVGSTTGDKSKGMALAYVDARDVMDRLDSVCGPEGWQDEYIQAGNGATCCRIGVALSDPWKDRNALWIWKSDGAGATSYEGDKGQFSDAFKRAAVKFGIGRYLYDCGAAWVAIEPSGKSFKIKKGETIALDAALAKAAGAQQWGDRSTANIYRLLRETLRLFAKTPAHLDEFIENNKGVFAQLKVGPKRELEAEVNRLRAAMTKGKAA